MRIKLQAENIHALVTDDQGKTLLEVKVKSYTLDANPDGLVAAMMEIGEAVERTLQ